MVGLTWIETMLPMFVISGSQLMCSEGFELPNKPRPFFDAQIFNVPDTITYKPIFAHNLQSHEAHELVKPTKLLKSGSAQPDRNERKSYVFLNFGPGTKVA